MDFTREEIERWRADVARRQLELFGPKIPATPPTAEPTPVCRHFRGSKFPPAVTEYAANARKNGGSRADIVRGIRLRFNLIVHPEAVSRAVKAGGGAW